MTLVYYDIDTIYSIVLQSMFINNTNDTNSFTIVNKYEFESLLTNICLRKVLRTFILNKKLDHMNTIILNDDEVAKINLSTTTYTIFFKVVTDYILTNLFNYFFKYNIDSILLSKNTKLVEVYSTIYCFLPPIVISPIKPVSSIYEFTNILFEHNSIYDISQSMNCVTSMPITNFFDRDIVFFKIVYSNKTFLIINDNQKHSFRWVINSIKSDTNLDEWYKEYNHIITKATILSK